MQVLITGGAGYVGTELVYRLAANDSVKKIIVYDNLNRGNYNLFLGSPVKDSKVQFIQGDILDSRKIRQVLKNVDVVFHLAAKVTTPFANVDSHFFEQVNHWGTAELVYAIEDLKTPKLIFLSSASVYGATAEPADENTALHPTSFYGISKQRAEEHVQRLVEKDQALIFRCGNVYGYSKSMRFDAVINHFMFEANFHRRLTINGNGRQHRSFIHVQKVVTVLEQALFKNIPCGMYNLTDRNLSVLEIVEVLRKIYAGLEFFFINQHIQLQDLQVKRSGRLQEYIPLAESDFDEELRDFGGKFSF